MTTKPHPQVLVAEDEAIVGMLVEAELVDAGFDVAGPFETCREASEWLETDTPDAAVLDLNLRDGPCTDVAVELVERGVPFVALSGAEAGDIPDALRSAPLIEKPSDLSKLPKVISGLIEARLSQ